MNLEERKKKIIQEFQALPHWEARYQKLIQMGKALPPLSSCQKIEKNKVKGCQSQVWLWAYFKEGQVYFEADSDATLVKGIIALLISVYHKSTPEEILTTKQNFIDEIGLRQHLSMSRAGGLAHMLKQIQFYALAFQAQSQIKTPH